MTEDCNEQHFPKWPINPTFLSLTRDSLESFNDDLNNQGIFLPDYIKGFLGVLANEEIVKSPMSLFQFLPAHVQDKIETRKGVIEKLEFDKNSIILNECLGNRDIVRINTDMLYKIQEPCNCLRKYVSSGHCSKLDSRVALFASASNPDELKKDVARFNENLADDDISKIEVKKCNNRSYIRYTCPHSLLDEYIFPIFFGENKEKVIACLILGQVNREGYDKDKAFFKFRDKIRAEKDGVDFESDFLKNLEREPFNADELNKKINLVCDRIDLFEDRIKQRVELHRKNYINNAFTKIKTKLLKNLSSINKTETEEALTQIKKYASSALKDICNTFESTNIFIRIFVIDTHNVKKIFRLFAKSDEKEIPNYIFDLDIDAFLEKYYKGRGHVDIIDLDDNIESEKDLPEERKKELIIARKKELIQTFNHPDDIEETDVLKLLPTLSNNVSFIIWKRHDNWIDTDDDTKENFRSKLTDFYILMAQIYATMVDSEKEKTLLDVIRITGHEVAQMIPSMINYTNRILQKIEFLTSIDFSEKERFRKDLDDLKDRIWLVRDIYSKSQLAFGLISLSKKWERLSDILVQGVKLYRPQAIDRCLSIPPPDYFTNNDIRVRVFIDNKYFGHIINNLLDNAVKYSYEGTKIDIRVYKEYGYLFIEVISFGNEIMENERIYELYIRGNNQKGDAEGLGVGMFLSKKIAIAHDFDLFHRSVRICDYHLPVLASRRHDYSNISINIPDFIFDDVVSVRKKYAPSKQEADLLIKKPTYQNEFVIKIPWFGFT